MSPLRLHGRVFEVVEGNASTVAPMAVAPSNERMIAGVAAASVSLGVAQLVGIPFGARADARAAIGSAVVDLTPGPMKEWAHRDPASVGAGGWCGIRRPARTHPGETTLG